MKTIKAWAVVSGRRKFGLFRPVSLGEACSIFPTRKLAQKWMDNFVALQHKPKVIPVEIRPLKANKLK